MLGSPTTTIEDVAPSAAKNTIVVTDSVSQSGRFVLQAWAHADDLWLLCGPPPLRSSKQSQPAHSRCLPAEIAQLAEGDTQQFVQGVLRDTIAWSQQHPERRVLLDDVSILAALLGYRRVYALVVSLQAAKVPLMIRCSSPEVEETTRWVGAGGSPTTRSEFQWELALPEIADCVVDVVPLGGGYTRDCQGRLIIAENVGLRRLSAYNFVYKDGKAWLTQV